MAVARCEANEANRAKNRAATLTHRPGCLNILTERQKKKTILYSSSVNQPLHCASFLILSDQVVPSIDRPLTDRREQLAVHLSDQMYRVTSTHRFVTKTHSSAPTSGDEFYATLVMTMRG